MSCNPKIICITGGKGGTGKTLVAVNLATMFMKKKYKVLLIDGDVENPNTYLLMGGTLNNKKVVEFFNTYDPYTEPLEKKKKIAAILLNADFYDFFALMRHNFYPMDKIPKIFSDFAVTEILLDNLKNLNIITEIKDEEDREWILLLTDIRPLVIFPEYLLPFIRNKFKGFDGVDKISYEIAKKALDLLEITYPEQIFE